MSKNYRINFIKILLLCFISIGITFLVLLLSFSIINNKYCNIAYKGVKICNIDASFKDKEEIIKMINDTVIPSIEKDKLNIKLEDKEYTYNYSDLYGKYDADKAANEAINYGKDFNVLKKFFLLKKDNGILINVSYECEESSINKIINEIKSDNDKEATNASLVRKDNKFEITEGKNGKCIDEDDLKEKIKNNLCYNLNDEINIKYKEVSPKITSNDLKKITGIMGSFETDYSSSSYARSNNIRVVTSIINGTVLMPGDEFSYGEYAKKGIGRYENAPGYVDGKVIDVEGGGICQPCSTLYRAVMKSNIKSIERHPHMYTVTYTKPGLDATVGDWGTLDYKFKNIYDFPIYIEGIAKNGTVNFNIYGDPSALNGFTYDMESEVYGHTAQSYLVTFDNKGNEVNREFIAEDTYKSH